jgi:hypothetical protein
MAAQQRQYEAFTLFNMRIVDMRHLWTPSDTYKGQKQQKPNYFAGFIIPKTQAQWSNEPALGGLLHAYGKLYQSNPQIVDWRIEDGDTPNAEGKSSDFAKGHWLLNASSGNPINVELVQPGGALVKLQNRVGVKPGDYCMIGGSAAVSQQNNRAIKLYLNAVVFTAAGEEIVFANSVSGADLMRQAQAQGLNVQGFAPSVGGFNPQGAPGFNPGQQGGGFPGNGMPANPQPGFAPANGPGSFAPTPNGPAMASPSNGQQFNPQGAPGFQQNGGAAPGMQQYGNPAGMPGNGGQFPSNNGQIAPNSAFPSNQQQFGGFNPNAGR